MTDLLTDRWVKIIIPSATRCVGYNYVPVFSEYNSYMYFSFRSIEFYAVSAIFQPCNDGDFQLKVISCENLKFPRRPSRAFSSSKSSVKVFGVLKGLLSLTPSRKNMILRLNLLETFSIYIRMMSAKFGGSGLKQLLKKEKFCFKPFVQPSLQTLRKT